MISSDDHMHHKLIGMLLLPILQFLTSKIVTILILEYVCLYHASQSKPTRDEALDRAYSRYCASGVHSEVTKQFFAVPAEYSIIQFTEFLLKRRL